jgi:hypothetical protein
MVDGRKIQELTNDEEYPKSVVYSHWHLRGRTTSLASGQPFLFFAKETTKQLHQRGEHHFPTKNTNNQVQDLKLNREHIIPSR